MTLSDRTRALVRLAYRDPRSTGLGCSDVEGFVDSVWQSSHQSTKLPTQSTKPPKLTVDAARRSCIVIR